MSGSLSVQSDLEAARAATRIDPATSEALQRLADALATVRRLRPELPALAVRWMHLKHPLHPIQQDLLQEPGAGTAPWRRPGFFYRLAQCVVYAVYLMGRLGILQLAFRREIARLRNQPFDLIARTLCFGTGRPADGSDFYYGDLQHRLARRGRRLLLLCADAQDGHAWTFARNHLATSGTCRLPELCLIPVTAPLGMMGRQLAASWRFLRLARRLDDPLERRIALAASVDCLAPDTAFTGLVYWAAKRAVGAWRPKAFLTFYEGQAWEHCARLGVLASGVPCQTVGYQHTVLLPIQLLAFDGAGDGLMTSRPDQVLCLGPQTAAMLGASHPRERLLVFGTFRSIPAGQDHAPRPGQRTVLVVPESGLLAETKVLLHFATRAARALPDHRFIFRCHPIMPFEAVRLHLQEDPRACQNVEVSRAPSIGEDFARASVVLYRGSSSVLYAVLHGLKPVYVHDEALLDTDPLFGLTGWRATVSSVADLAETLRRYAATPAYAAAEEWRGAAAYVQAYTVPVDEASVERFLEAVGLGRGASGR